MQKPAKTWLYNKLRKNKSGNSAQEGTTGCLCALVGFLRTWTKGKVSPSLKPLPLPDYDQ